MGCILFQGFYVGRMRGIIICDNSLSPFKPSQSMMLVTNWGSPTAGYVIYSNFCIKGALEHDRVNKLKFTTTTVKMLGFLLYVYFLLVANKVDMWPYCGHFQL